MVAASKGSIVNMGSMSGLIVNRPQSAPSYMVSKGAVHMLTKALAVEWAKSGVRVNALAPGYVATEMTLKMRERPELFETWMDMTPMGRCGEPHEIASAILFLASPAVVLRPNRRHDARWKPPPLVKDWTDAYRRAGGEMHPGKVLVRLAISETAPTCVSRGCMRFLKSAKIGGGGLDSFLAIENEKDLAYPAN